VLQGFDPLLALAEGGSRDEFLMAISYFGGCHRRVLCYFWKGMSMIVLILITFPGFRPLRVPCNQTKEETSVTGYLQYKAQTRCYGDPYAMDSSETIDTE
jgi:hypothetical protein